MKKLNLTHRDIIRVLGDKRLQLWQIVERLPQHRYGVMSGALSILKRNGFICHNHSTGMWWNNPDLSKCPKCKKGHLYPTTSKKVKLACGWCNYRELEEDRP